LGEIPFLDYRATESAAARFLAAHHPKGGIPVPIEPIVEHRLGMDIVPVRDLFERIGVSGFLANDADAIYVDLFEMESHEPRYRLTLAHEVGHRVLHEAFYRRARIRRIEEFLRFRESLSGADLDRLEIQAMNFAGAVLMPRAPLEKEVRRAIAEARSRVGPDILRSGRFIPALAARIGRRFVVSTEAAEWRLRLSGTCGEA
jgi:uncharacterized protein DUF955